MKRRLPRKLKKGFRSSMLKRDTKWKRKATAITRKALEDLTLLFINPPSNRFEPGGIVSEKPVNSKGEYVMGKDEAERLREMIQQPESQTYHATIKHDQLLKSIRRQRNE